MKRTISACMCFAFTTCLFWTPSAVAQNELVIEPGALRRSIVISDVIKAGGMSGSQIGFGIANPKVDLHIVSSDTPTIRLHQNANTGNPAQAWDLEGNETFFSIKTHFNNRRPFQIAAFAPNNSLIIHSDGNTAFGTGGNPFARITVKGTVGFQNGLSPLIFMFRSGTNGGSKRMVFAESPGFAQWGMAYKPSPNEEFVIQTNNNNELLRFPVSGSGGQIIAASGAHLTNGGVWQNASSRSYKQDIGELSAEDAIDAIKKMEPVTYRYKKDLESGLQVGFIAEDVPELIATPDRKSISSMDVVAVVTRVVKEQQKELKVQQGEIQQLQNDKEELVERLDALEQSILQMQK